jgi:hypothetical protein
MKEQGRKTIQSAFSNSHYLHEWGERYWGNVFKSEWIIGTVLYCIF